MAGMRRLSDDEYELIESYFTKKKELRNLAMFSIQRWAGYRIREVLSLKLSDLYTPDGEVNERIYIQPKKMKGGKKPRVIPIHPKLKDILQKYRDLLQSKNLFNLAHYAFQSRKGANEPISSVQAWRILKKAFTENGIYESVSTHSLRKTFCEKVYRSSGNDIVATQYVMGHKDPVTTLHYLAQNQERLDEVVMRQ